MKTYARLQDGAVAEFLQTGLDITKLFNPAIVWADVTGNATVQIGWRLQPDGSLAAPPPPVVPKGAGMVTVTVAALNAQLAALQAQLNTLIPTSK